MTRKEARLKAQDLILEQIAKIGYGEEFEQFVSEVGDPDEALDILKAQMDRVAKMFGYSQAWFG